MDETLKLKFKRHRTQITVADTTPVITEAYADLSAATIAKFQEIKGSKPVVLFKFVGGTAPTVTIRPFYIDACKDYTAAGIPTENILSWGDTIDIDNTCTRLELVAPYGSKLFIAVTSLTSVTSLDIYIGDGLTN